MYKPETDIDLNDLGLSDNIPDEMEFIGKGSNESLKDFMDNMREKCLNFLSYVQGVFVKPMPQVEQDQDQDYDIEIRFYNIGTYRDNGHGSKEINITANI